MKAPPLIHILVGSYPYGDAREFLPVSAAELSRSQHSIERILNPFSFGSGRLVLLISLLEEGSYAVPFERAVMNLGLLSTNADTSRFEAQRIESICRRFDVAAIVGVTTEILDGLLEAGYILEETFKRSTVWALPDAASRLRKIPDISLRIMAEAGPALGLECISASGIHIDSNEWHCDVDRDELLLTSRLIRATPFRRHRTAMFGELISEPCDCGNADIRFRPFDKQYSAS